MLLKINKVYFIRFVCVKSLKSYCLRIVYGYLYCFDFNTKKGTVDDSEIY